MPKRVLGPVEVKVQLTLTLDEATDSLSSSCVSPLNCLEHDCTKMAGCRAKLGAGCYLVPKVAEFKPDIRIEWASGKELFICHSYRKSRAKRFRKPVTSGS